MTTTKELLHALNARIAGLSNDTIDPEIEAYVNMRLTHASDELASAQRMVARFQVRDDDAATQAQRLIEIETEANYTHSLMVPGDFGHAEVRHADEQITTITVGMTTSTDYAEIDDGPYAKTHALEFVDGKFKAVAK